MQDIQLVPALRQSLFIAGTDTSVGKTTVAVALLRALARSGLRAAGMKPVATGAELTSHGLRNDDALELGAAGNVRLPYELTNPFCFEQATSPHLAAERVGKSIDIAAILQAFRRVQAEAELVVVEGAGGWLAPVGHPPHPAQAGPTMQDVARALGLPVVLVVGIRLGCISHALLTADAIIRSPLPLAGWIANPIDEKFADGNDYVESLQDRLPCPLLWAASRVILPSQ